MRAKKSRKWHERFDSHNWALHGNVNTAFNDTRFQFAVLMPTLDGTCDLCFRESSVFRPLPESIQSFGLRSLCEFCSNAINACVEGEWLLCWTCGDYESLRWAIADFWLRHWFGGYFWHNDFNNWRATPMLHDGPIEPEIIRYPEPPIELQVRVKRRVQTDI